MFRIDGGSVIQLPDFLVAFYICTYGSFLICSCVSPFFFFLFVCLFVCLLDSSKTFVFQFDIQKFKDQDI